MKHRACISGWILTAVLAAAPLATAQSTTKPSPLSGTTAGAKLAPIQKAAAARKAVEQKSAVAAETQAQAEPAAAQQPAPAAPASRPKVLRDRRDPFESMLRDKQAEQQPPSCGTHIRSITVGQVVLTGIVKMPAGYIAVISAPPDRTYFLREGNAVCNGTVQAITPDSIVFMEDVIDPSGKPAKREVIKKIPAEAK